MAKQRISYVPLEQMDAEMRKEMERCQREGTPRPESSAVRAHVPACFWFFANSWRDIFRNGVLDHAIKELCRLYVSRSVQCEYCGNQRSVKATVSGAVIEDHVLDLLNFEKSTAYDERQKAALAYAEAITWHLNTDDAFWTRMHTHFSEPELVELGCMIGLTLGQQSWLRLLNIEHHAVMAGTSASMAPGFEDSKTLAASKASAEYWAKPVPAKSLEPRGDPMMIGHEASWLDVAGRVLIALFFLWVAITNLSQARIKDHIERLTLYKAPFPAPMFWIGEALSIVSALLVLSGWQAELGVYGLMLFLVLATGLLLRFWEAPNPMARNGMRLALLSNTAIFGGLLLLLQNVR